jgi:hypothetical protein
VSDFIPERAAEIPQTPYANELATHLGQDHIDRLTEVFVEIGVADWLERHPFSRLELRATIFHNRQPVNGLYWFDSRLVQISSTRDPREYHQQFVWQNVYSVSSTAQTQTEAIQKT